MEEPIEDVYFDWLCAKVRPDRTPNYLELFRIMHSHIFVAVHRLDENRQADAEELRVQFLDEYRITHVDGAWVNQECSVFEVLIAFSETAAFQIDEMTASEWFWQFITNLKLEDYRRASTSDHNRIIDILNRFVMRTYGSNGDGGLFPLRRPRRNQREVEIWYQFCDYVEDNGLLFGLL